MNRAAALEQPLRIGKYADYLAVFTRVRTSHPKDDVRRIYPEIFHSVDALVDARDYAGATRILLTEILDPLERSRNARTLHMNSLEISLPAHQEQDMAPGVDSTIYRNFLRARCSVDPTITWKTWFGRALMEFLIGDTLTGAEWTKKLATDMAHRIDVNIVESWSAPNVPETINYTVLNRHLSFIVSILTA